MASCAREDGFPFATYKDYVSTLAVSDSAYQKLSHFFAAPYGIGHGDNVYGENQVPANGSVNIIDHFGGKLKSLDFSFGAGGSEKSAKECIYVLDQRPVQSEVRIILLSYHRDPFTGAYTGVETNVLDYIARKFRVHPEVLMWHFGFDYGLDKRFFFFAQPPLPSALSNRTFCHLQNDNSLFTYCLSSSNKATKPDTGTVPDDLV